MRYALALALCLLMMPLAPAWAQEKVNYWLMEVPVIEGGANIEQERDDAQFMSHLTYEISIKNPDTIYKTYNKFYKDKSWDKRLENNPSNGKAWEGHTFNITPEGTPVATYGGFWLSPNKAFMAKLTLTLTEYDNTVFKGKVEILTTPNYEMILTGDVIMSTLQITSEPRDIFIAAQVFGKDINDMTKFDFTKVPEEYKNEKVVIAYKKMSDKIKQKYKEFGDKYVDREKIPVK
ncbi:MAG: hypothetical protein KDI61_04835 [Alphaproteobacteria bacterium]|nr:hypothetical protein [Alphaproteobacteria bacterium]MCB1839573.1 hypothetical protein [Alphaproteobacteria bacterium]